MLRLTFLARLKDRLPLAASMDDGSQYDMYKQKRKLILKKLQKKDNPPHRMTVSVEKMEFHILIENGVVFMTLCEKSFNANLAYAYLDELKKEFMQNYGGQVDLQEKIYPFIRFDTFIQKTRRVYCDTRTKKNLEAIEEDLDDVKMIMRKNFTDVVTRGEKLSAMEDLSAEILESSTKMRKSATDLNRYYLWRTYGPACVVIAIVLIILVVRYYLY